MKRVSYTIPSCFLLRPIAFKLRLSIDLKTPTPQTDLIDHKQKMLEAGLKVSKFQHEFMKLSFLPKYEPKIERISAL